MILKIYMVTRVMDFIWMSYSGPHMLTGLLPEDSNLKSSNIARFGNR